MEPIEVMKKEKTQLERLEKMRRYIYTPIAELSVEYSLQKNQWHGKKDIVWSTKNFRKTVNGQRYLDVHGFGFEARFQRLLPENT